MSGGVALVGSDDWQVRWRAPIAGFAVLDAAFAPDAVLVSDVIDSGAMCSVYCFSLTGQLLWQRETPPETNMRWLAWDSETGEWLGIRHNVENRQADMLVRWSTEGDPLSRVALRLFGEYAILPSGQLLVTGRGDILDTKSARHMGRLPASQSDPAEVGGR